MTEELLMLENSVSR